MPPEGIIDFSKEKLPVVVLFCFYCMYERVVEIEIDR
jgi:hypothetical protein